MTHQPYDSQGLTLTEILDRLQAIERHRSVSVNDVLSAFGPRTFGPLLLIPALVAMLPVIGALPGVSWGCAGLITLISVQFMLSSRKLWLPRFLREAHIGREAFDGAIDRARPVARRAGMILKPRLQPLTGPLGVWMVSAVCFVLGLLMFVYSIFPGGIVVPAFSVLLLAVALTAHDGLVLLLGLLTAAGSGIAVMIASSSFSRAFDALF